MKRTLIPLLAFALLLSGCEKEESGLAEYPKGNGEIPYVYPDKNGDQIPDFSHVGYHWGEEEPPVVPVVKTLSSPGTKDATEMIQKALDECEGGAVLLAKGTYNVSGTLYIRKSGVVLRGAGEGKTIITATAKTQCTLISMGGVFDRKDVGTKANITENYVPVGRYWVEVDDASSFSKGDDVILCRPATKDWISDLKMDVIPNRADGGVSVQWKPGSYHGYFERKVMKVEGNKVWFDNPVVMAMDQKYGGGQLWHYTFPGRITECGVENLTLYSNTSGSDVDEDHGWQGVVIKNARHCWVRNVTTKRFGYTCVHMTTCATNITVTDCTSLEPVSIIDGSRRYAFHISDGQLCLVKNCHCEQDRHQYVTGAVCPGPNVFYNNTSTNAICDAGPHQRWAMGILYDNIITDGELKVQDRGSMGTGHGWAGVNHVFWNCTATGGIVCQSPWVSGQNWCIGCIGKKLKAANINRPEGNWASLGKNVSPQSLYRAQFSLPSHVNVLAELGGTGE